MRELKKKLEAAQKYIQREAPNQPKTFGPVEACIEEVGACLRQSPEEVWQQGIVAKLMEIVDDLVQASELCQSSSRENLLYSVLDSLITAYDALTSMNHRKGLSHEMDIESYGEDTNRPSLRKCVEEASSSEALANLVCIVTQSKRHDAEVLELAAMLFAGIVET